MAWSSGKDNLQIIMVLDRLKSEYPLTNRVQSSPARYEHRKIEHSGLHDSAMEGQGPRLLVASVSQRALAGVA